MAQRPEGLLQYLCPPGALYELREQGVPLELHPDPPYNGGTWSWGLDGATPGPTFHSRYGTPSLVRIINELPPVGATRATFALPSTTTHLHNFHSASESDGTPQDWIDSGEFWDHRYSTSRRVMTAGEADDPVVPRSPAELHRDERVRRSERLPSAL